MPDKNKSSGQNVRDGATTPTLIKKGATVPPKTKPKPQDK